MSFQPPLQPGTGPGQGPAPFDPYAHPPHGVPPPYGLQPAYVGMPSPAPRSGGINPWLAGLIGVLIGGIGAMVLSVVLPMIFFGALFGGLFGPGFDEGEGFMEGPQRVAVGADGSVSGVALAEVLEEAPWYEDVTCPDTAGVATDVTTVCRGTDGFEDLRVVVVFEGSSGQFSTADVFP